MTIYLSNDTANVSHKPVTTARLSLLSHAILLVLTSVLSACSAPVHQTDTDAPASSTNNLAAIENTKEVTESILLATAESSNLSDDTAVEFDVPPEEVIPTYAPFKPDTLFDLIVAELAGTRSMYSVALSNYTRQAYRTRDAAVIERAYQLADYLQARSIALDMALLWDEVASNDATIKSYAALELMRSEYYLKAYEYIAALLPLNGDAPFDILAESIGYQSQWQATRERILKEYLTLQRSYPDLDSLNLGIAWLQLREKQYENVLVTLARLSEAQRDSIASFILQGRSYFELGRNNKALQILSRGLKQYPEENQLRLLYTRALMATEEWESARTQLDKMSSNSNEKVLLALGLLALEGGMTAEAIDLLQRATTSPQYDDAANYYLGTIYEAQQKLALAMRHYQKVVRGELVTSAATAYCRVFLQAEESFDPAAAIPTYQVQEHLGLLRYHNPEYSGIFYLLESDVLAQQQQLTLAIAQLNIGIAENQQSVPLLYARAALYAQLGDHILAEQDLRLALTIEENNASVLNALGYTLLEHYVQDVYQKSINHPLLTEAKALILQAYQLEPTDAAILDSVGWLYFHLGDYTQAEQYLQQSYTLQPDADIAAHLGEVLWITGHHKEAMAIWQQALEQTPNHPLLTATVRRFVKTTTTPSTP